MSLLCLEDLTKYYPSQALPAVDNLSLELEKGEILALLGPSGCGKTTTLRLIAGFERPDAGKVEIDGTLMADGHRFVPPEQRGVGVVFQEYTLFPHLTVAENIVFGLRKLSAASRRARLHQMLETVGLSSLARRYPHELSGGQQQRVALARALAPRPAVLLLDEPFSNLDADLRTQMLHEVYTILRESGTTAVFVTHDHEEAFMVADRVGVLNRGRLEQLGRPEEIYDLPATRFVARFVGNANFIPGRVLGTHIETAIGTFPNVANFPPEAVVEVMIRPDQFELRPDSAGDAMVVSSRFRGADTLVVVQLTSGLLVQTHQPSSLLLPPRERVRVVAKPCHVTAFLAPEP
ncbi:MAG TPA: ABC transporter ATP-binding protein [Candidatus Tectomicrobia bacterium]|nr:ABC transporter ATP-binding protein [Candidatus Tectomicrobia bacterium]